MSEGREKEGRKDHSTAIADLLRVRDVLRDCAERMEREPYQYTRATLWHRLKAAALAVDPEMWGPACRALASFPQCPDSGGDCETDVAAYAHGLHKPGAVAWCAWALDALSTAAHVLDMIEDEQDDAAEYVPTVAAETLRDQPGPDPALFDDE